MDWTGSDIVVIVLQARVRIVSLAGSAFAFDIEVREVGCEGDSNFGVGVDWDSFFMR